MTMPSWSALQAPSARRKRGPINDPLIRWDEKDGAVPLRQAVPTHPRSRHPDRKRTRVRHPCGTGFGGNAVVIKIASFGSGRTASRP